MCVTSLSDSEGHVEVSPCFRPLSFDQKLLGQFNITIVLDCQPHKAVTIAAVCACPSMRGVKSLLGPTGSGVIAPAAPQRRAAPCTGVSELAATLVTLLVYCHQLQPLADSISNQEDDII